MIEEDESERPDAAGIAPQRCAPLRNMRAESPDSGLQKPTPVVKNFRRFLGLWAKTTDYN